mmetsp:Transcript_2811/g.4246  ORF Transcript_2811/g.4246 Transcript_2811/m.4246 type:complete len:260 (-) Transcript_2811:370-1149(-)|eukprot:CAMPEP_0197240356 /NCGR_PEP_ID=MMETSP1429-20130617/6656_1 /TAXON_ID=49237 /ORGANISM="Chaetoceros  sp., Strain UNC1202" /LENGTH=259 /DNA_ID=CAMNT_0042699977 /DNA_START=108 /DNA_END=887 /DNA_ORIENTATION=-
MKLSNQRWNILLVLLSITNIHAFVIQPTRTTTTPFFSSSPLTKLHESDGNNAEPDDQPLSFDDATQALKDEEDSARSASRGMMMEEDAKDFEEKRETYNAMRDKIRSRATDLNMNKSVATQEAIKAATQRAAAGEQASTPTVDLSKFNDSLLTDPEDELSDEQMAQIDKVGQMSIVDQVMEELKNTKFPTPDATLKQAGLMVVIFLVTATAILKADEFLRFQYTDWGFIPKSGEVLDYSDLTLPEGFTDNMSDIDLDSM